MSSRKGVSSGRGNRRELECRWRVIKEASTNENIDDWEDEFWVPQEARLNAAMKALDIDADVDTDYSSEEGRMEKIMRHSEGHSLPLRVVGVFGKAIGGSLTASDFVDQMCHREQQIVSTPWGGIFGTPEFDGSASFDRIKLTYRDQDNVLFLALEAALAMDASLWKAAMGEHDGGGTNEGTGSVAASDAVFLAQCGEAELVELRNLSIMFNLCDVILWLSPGSAPRADADSVRLLGRLFELQGHPQLVSHLANSRPISTPPTLLLVHTDLKVPYQAVGPDLACLPPPLQSLEAAEKALDGKWRASIRRFAQIDGKAGQGLFRLPRPCAIAVPGPFARHEAQDILVLADALEVELHSERLDAAAGIERQCGETSWRANGHAVWPMDRLRARLGEFFKFLLDSQSQHEVCTVRDWMDGAHELEVHLKASVDPAGRLPTDLASLVFGSNGDCGSGQVSRKDKPAEPSARSRKGDLVAQLRRASFAELLFSLSTAQRGFEEAQRAYAMSTGTPGSTLAIQDQKLQAALRVLGWKVCAPLSCAASEVLRAHCESQLVARRSCGVRSVNGRVCTLREGHSEEHRSSLMRLITCLCGKTQLSRADIFDAPPTPQAGLPPASACCRSSSFLSFLPLNCDFTSAPKVVPASPHGIAAATSVPTTRASRHGGVVPGADILPSVLPDARGFVAIVAEQKLQIDPVQGCRLPGFGEVANGSNASGYSHLSQFSRWRLPVATIPSCGTTSDTALPRVVLVGFEYVCPQGIRFFLPPTKFSGLALSKSTDARERRKDKHRRVDRASAQEAASGDGPPSPELPGLLDEGEFEAAPLCAYRLFAPCIRHRKTSSASRGAPSKQDHDEPPCVAQLSRLWVQTPPASKSGEIIEAAPRVSVVDTQAEKDEDGLAPEVVFCGGRVALPTDSFVQLILPSVFHKPSEEGQASIPLPGFHTLTKSDADRCRLLPYTFCVTKPT
eukprot:TRINITY_DN40604_c0_g1_i1.p1 TRINITY_DN40604_c0_g1~~TRINITY_DN40604_c0_g1_i1.p1  ORF type:complete len:963 (-),score=153.14 TRINITY_DN40604_c0_g1_i1:544-3432(-)